MQSENTSKTPRKSAKAKTLEPVEAAKAEVIKKARATKSSLTKSSASKKSAASPKHHHSATTDKVKAVKSNALAEIALVETLPVPATIHEAPIAAGAATQRAIGHEDIARLAHAYWTSRNFADGWADEDWLRAEKELASKS